jgi:hypothetical protein
MGELSKRLNRAITIPAEINYSLRFRNPPEHRRPP